MQTLKTEIFKMRLQFAFLFLILFGKYWVFYTLSRLCDTPNQTFIIQQEVNDNTFTNNAPHWQAYTSRQVIVTLSYFHCASSTKRPFHIKIHCTSKHTLAAWRRFVF
jgi:hypothetical protein